MPAHAQQLNLPLDLTPRPEDKPTQVTRCWRSARREDSLAVAAYHRWQGRRERRRGGR